MDIKIVKEAKHLPVVSLECVSLRKSKMGLLNPKEFENGFCISSLDRSIRRIHSGSGFCVSFDPP